MNSFQCRICDNIESNVRYRAKEMMFGLREEFLYFQCSMCGCLQIAEIPKNLNRYYPPESYYSFQLPLSGNSIKSKLATYVRKVMLRIFFENRKILNNESIKFILRNKEYKWITQIPGLNLSSDILDVGSGKGLLLQELNKLGFTKLTGIDPFVDSDFYFSGGVQVLKKDIYELDKRFDLIMLNHTFEHMNNPHETFEQLYKVLNSGGNLVIRIPVVDSFSWRKYGISWFQLDAPRHFFLHTVKSMSILAKNNGFDLVNINYDSNENQFYYSEKYLRDKTLFEPAYLNRKILKKWKKFAANLNSLNDGDQACFIFSKRN
jgi:SAM-dependent methyltransferase